MEVKTTIANATKRRGVHLEVRHTGGDKYEVVHVGHPHLKSVLGAGDEVSSSDLDDFENDGYKVHEVD